MTTTYRELAASHGAITVPAIIDAVTDAALEAGMKDFCRELIGLSAVLRSCTPSAAVAGIAVPLTWDMHYIAGDVWTHGLQLVIGQRITEKTDVDGEPVDSRVMSNLWALAMSVIEDFFTSK